MLLHVINLQTKIQRVENLDQNHITRKWRACVLPKLGNKFINLREPQFLFHKSNGISRQSYYHEAYLYRKRNTDKSRSVLEAVLVPVLVQHGDIASLLGINSNLGREGMQCHKKSSAEKQTWAQNLTIVELALRAGSCFFWLKKDWIRDDWQDPFQI